MIIAIISEKDESWSYDTETQRVFKDGKLVPELIAEPVFSKSSDSEVPEFSGIYIKATGQVLSRSGKYSNLTNPDSL